MWVSSPEPAVEVITPAGTCPGRLRRQTEYLHRYPRVHVERRPQRGAGPAHAVRRDVVDPGRPGLVGPTVTGGDHRAGVVPSLPGFELPGCLLFGLSLTARSAGARAPAGPAATGLAAPP